MCHTFYHKLQSKFLCKSLVLNKQNQIVMTSAVVDCAVTMLQQVVSQYVLYYLLGMRRDPPTKETVEKSDDVIKSTPVKTKRSKKSTRRRVRKDSQDEKCADEHVKRWVLYII